MSAVSGRFRFAVSFTTDQCASSWCQYSVDTSIVLHVSHFMSDSRVNLFCVAGARSLDADERLLLQEGC